MLSGIKMVDRAEAERLARDERRQQKKDKKKNKKVQELCL
jgi:DNA replication protein DnaD